MAETKRFDIILIGPSLVGKTYFLMKLKNDPSIVDYNDVPDEKFSQGEIYKCDFLNQKFRFWSYDDCPRSSKNDFDLNCKDLFIVVVKPLVIDKIDEIVVDINKKYPKDKIMIMINQNMFHEDFSLKKRKTPIGELDEVTVDFKRISDGSNTKNKILKYIQDAIKFKKSKSITKKLNKAINDINLDDVDPLDLELLDKKLLDFRDNVAKKLNK